jgi:hypothetical protein
MSFLWTCKNHIQIKIRPTMWQLQKYGNISLKKKVNVCTTALMQEGWGLHITYHNRITYSTWLWKLITLSLTSHILVIIVISFRKFKPLTNFQSFFGYILWLRYIIITSYQLRKFHMSPCLLKYSFISLPASQQQTHHHNHNDGLQRENKLNHSCRIPSVLRHYISCLSNSLTADKF